MKITPHFSLAEFAQPQRHGLPRVEYPERWRKTRLRVLAELLEVIYGRVEVVALAVYLAKRIRIRVLSGFRGIVYNRAIGSKDTSQHVQGRAADIVAEWHDGAAWYAIPAADLHAMILALYHDGTLRDRPTRLGGLGLYPGGHGKLGFVHVDTRPGRRLARWTGSRVTT